MTLVAITVALTGCADIATDTTAAGTSETTAAPLASVETDFDTVIKTPPDVFQSYVSEYSMSVGVESGAVEIGGEGAWTGAAFECDMSLKIGKLELPPQSVAANADELWFNDGTGYKVSTPTQAENILASCPSSPQFWADYISPGIGHPDGERVEFSGRQATKVDLAKWIDFTGSLGMIPNVRRDLINEMWMWVDVETNVVLGVYADIATDPAAMAGFGVPNDGAETVKVIIDLHIDRINDPAVTVDLPTG